MKIDAHHHFWNYSLEEYGWIDDSMSALRRDFTPADLQMEIARTHVDGVITVQARQTLEETRWLLQLANQHDFIRGVVGWVPLIEESVESHIEQFCAESRLVGVRHVLQGEPDPRYMLREDFNQGVALLKKYQIVYDLLIFAHHLPTSIEFVDRHPEQLFVLDHIAKPNIKGGEMEPWAQNIRELARRENVACKISGMVTEADFHRWQPDQLRPYFEVVLSAFGPKRLMFGSDWPVCLAACEYKRWHEIVSTWIKDLSTAEQAQIMGETAMRIYRLMALR